MSLGFPSTHVQSDFTQERLGYHHVDAIDTGEVDSRDALQFAAEFESRSILSWLCFFSLRFHLRRWGRNSIHKTRQVLLQLQVTLGDPLLIDVVHLDFLLQYKQQFRTPVTLQALGNLLLGGMNPWITEFRQLSRIAFSGHNRPNDGLSGQSAHIADDVCQLYVHLRQCLLYSLNARRCSMYVFSPLPPVGTEYANLRRRLEGVVQQSIGMQLQ